MKYLLPLILLVGCGSPEAPKSTLKKGDCVSYSVPNHCERWQKNCQIVTEKIIEVGVENYHLMRYRSQYPHSYYIDTEKFSWVEINKKVNCPLNFGDDPGDEIIDLDI